MAAINPPRPVKLFVGMLSADRDLMRRARQLLTRMYGAADSESEYWPFDNTEYYAEQLGHGVEKYFVGFESLVGPEALADIKRQTNELEVRIAEDLGLPPGSRPVNLDPGYVTLSKVVLATTKDYAHRIYMQRGIYAEVTLRFYDGGWQPWPWTYPDYGSGRYNNFFLQMRERLKTQYAARMDDPSGARQE